MKINQEKKFSPITITLETREEAESLMLITAGISGSGKERELTDKIYEYLEELGITYNSSRMEKPMYLAELKEKESKKRDKNEEF